MKTLQKLRNKIFTKPKSDKAYMVSLAWLIDTFTLPVQKSSYKTSLGFRVTTRAKGSKREGLKPHSIIFQGYSWLFGINTFSRETIVQRNWHTYNHSTVWPKDNKPFDFGNHLMRVLSKEKSKTMKEVVVSSRARYLGFSIDLGYTEEMITQIRNNPFAAGPEVMSARLDCDVRVRQNLANKQIETSSYMVGKVDKRVEGVTGSSGWLTNINKWYANSQKKQGGPFSSLL